MNRTNSEYALPSKAAEDRRTPRRWRVGDSRAHFRQVLECAGPAALWIAQTGSWSQCMRRSERGLSMNRPGHRIVAWLGKAAPKTHALQTLRDCRASPKRAKRLECVRFIGAFRQGAGQPAVHGPNACEKTKG